MPRKTFLPITMLLLLSSLSFFKINAQQKKSFKGKLFIQTLHPATDPLFNRIPLRIHSLYRSVNGTNNNIGNSKNAWGSTDIELYRELPPQYGPSDPKNAMGGVNRPSAREISNAVVDEPVTTFNARGLSAFVYVWGQFLDHDMSLTPTDTIEYVPISLPKDEKIFTEEIPFFRSQVHAGSGTNSPRQQLNLNTAWIDGSVVYGSESSRAKWLRTFKDGKMKMSAGNLLPFNTVTGEKDAAIDPLAPDMANDSGHKTKTFVAGDIRAAEHPGIISLHTLFIREHNRICDRLIAEGYRNDEQIYQMARKEIGGLIEAITYQEFLPAIGIRLHQYRGYNDNARPDIANTFATAGYRIGHTMVADDIMLIDNDCKEIPPGEFDLIEAFWNPQLIIDYGLEPFLKGFAAHTQYETDTKINSVLRNFLFTSPNDPTRFGIDLGSLNIQRGRDHGLPDYNTVRKFYTGRGATRFSDITTNDTLAASLKTLYGNVNNIDLWVGILAEDHLPGTSVGRTMHEMLRVQFEKLRDGDFYFYLNDPSLPSKTKNRIASTKFSDVLKRNTKLTNLQSNVFFSELCPGESEEAIASKKVNPETIPESQFKIYPNPVAGILNIDLGGLKEPGVIKLFTANGILLKTITPAADQKNIQVNTSDLGTGIYFVR
ncbi:MAG TPA: peroxidase family protein, partial [Chitinophagaceae bacterium]|nr:peroxidase family protein [Chitinophagaceae bacterium]